MNRAKKIATAVCGMFAVGAGLMFGRAAILADEFPSPDTELNDLPGDLPMGRYIEYIATDVSTNSVSLSNGVLVVGSEALDLFEMTNLTYEAAVRDAAEGTKEAIASLSNEMAKVSFSGDYFDLTNKPQVNGVSLTGNKAGADLGVLDLAGGTMTGGIYFGAQGSLGYLGLAYDDENHRLQIVDGWNENIAYLEVPNAYHGDRVAFTHDISVAISPTSPTFSNAVLSVGLGIDTNTVAAINELVDSTHSLPLTGATSVGALLLALAAAIAALKRGKADLVSPATDGDIAALDASGNLKLSGMNRDGNGNLDATEFTFTPEQVADYDSASVGTVISKAATPVVLHDGQHYVVRKSFAKTNGGWNVDSVTGKVVLPGASGMGSTALGDATQAIGSGAVSTGKNTKASGAGTLSSGQETDAIGTGAHAEGQSTSATATCAHSEGYFTIAQNQSEHAQGEYNASHTGATASERTLNSIGIGDSNERKNAVEVMRDGKMFVLGLGGYDGKSPTASGVLDLATAVNNPTRIFNSATMPTDALDDKGQLFKSNIPGTSKFVVTKNGTTTEWPYYRFQSEGNAFNGHSVFSFGTWYTDLVCYDPTDGVVGFTHYNAAYYTRDSYVWDVQVPKGLDPRAIGIVLFSGTLRGMQFGADDFRDVAWAARVPTIESNPYARFALEAKPTAWADSTTYTVGVCASYDGKAYRCKTEHTSGSTFDASKWDEIPVLSQKTDKPSTYADGNLAKFDSTGNPVDSQIPAANVAVKSDLRYSLVTKTMSGGAVTLDDRADNYVDARALGSSDSIDIDFPALVDGKSRDFVLAVECGANPPTISYAAFVTIMAEDASSLTPEEGMNIYSFTEFKTNMFIAVRKLVSTVVDNSPENGDQLMLAMQKRGIDTTGITDFEGVETALGLSDTDTPQDAINAIMN